MGCAVSRRYAELCEESRVLRAKIHAMEEEMVEMRRRREKEARANEQREAYFASKEGEWRRERRRHGEEVGELRKRVEEEEGRRRALEEVGGGGVDQLLGLQRLGEACRLVEQMKEEQARREQAVEKWKQLYLAIKAELDALILRTNQGERLCWMAEEEVIERLQGELKAKEEMVEALRSHLAAMEMEGTKRDREIDILRQSLRILSSKKRNRSRKTFVRSLRS